MLVLDWGTLRLHHRVTDDVQDNKWFRAKHVSLAEHVQCLLAHLQHYIEALKKSSGGKIHSSTKGSYPINGSQPVCPTSQSAFS